MDIVITVNVSGELRGIGWIGIQPDGSVSVGLNDRAFISPDFKSKNFVWSAFNRETLHYLVPEDGTALKGVKNPHLTYHPPHWFQLGVTKGKKLFEGIADLDIMLQQDGIVPWVRFVSRPIGTLKRAASVRHPERTRHVVINVTSLDASIGLGVDFLRKDNPKRLSERLHQETIECVGYDLFVFAEALPPQRATLSWYHQR